jgi:hypothetical protein
VTQVNVRTKKQTEHDRVVSWRREELERAGYAPTAARRLARNVAVDLHAAIDLIRNGCSPEMAARILL